jgi:hypothetical protein
MPYGSACWGRSKYGVIEYQEPEIGLIPFLGPRAIPLMNRLCYAICRLASVLLLAIMVMQSIAGATIYLDPARKYAHSIKEGVTSGEAIVSVVSVPFVCVLAPYIIFGKPWYPLLLGAAILVTTISIYILAIPLVYQTVLGIYFNMECIVCMVIYVFLQTFVLLGVLLRSRSSCTDRKRTGKGTEKERKRG